MKVDILIVGAGPAGMAAALAAAPSGARIAVLDDNPAAGGQIWRDGPQAHLPALAREHRRSLEAQANIELLPASRVVALPGYLNALGLIHMGPGMLYICKVVSFVTMCAGLLVGAGMILGGMWRGQQRNRRDAALNSAA